MIPFQNGDTGLSVRQTIPSYANGWVNAKHPQFGAVGDDSTNDTAALLAFAAYPHKKKVLPPGVYLWDGSDLEFGDEFELFAQGATIKVIAGSYSGNWYGICNRADVAYSAGAARHKNCKVSGLTIDGNAANVTHTGSFAGIHFHQVDGVVVEDVRLSNLPGSTNGLPGVDIRFCTDAHVSRAKTVNTGRQGVLFWESVGSVRDCNLGYSREREPLLISSDGPVQYQRSKVFVENVTADNAATTNGTHVFRVSGSADATIRSCDLTAKSGLNCVFVTDTPEKDVTLEDNDYRSGSQGLKVASDGPKTVTSRGNRYHDCDDTIEWIAAGAGTRFVSEGEDLRGNTGQPVQISFCEDVVVRSMRINGGDSNCLIDNFETLEIDGMQIKGMTSATQSLVVSGGGTPQISPPNISGVVIDGNTADQMTILENAFVNDCFCTIGGAGIPMSRLGAAYMWRDTTGDYRVSFAQPDKANINTAGVVLGTQS